ncbi:MAG: ligase-associated DNA damage response endonuclease PdeM [Ahrensia sp.]|nr:ligase-associated DNA damage response endonuclease PdeM [Ahrensia sp.]
MSAQRDDEAWMAALADQVNNRLQTEPTESPTTPVWKGCCIHAVNGAELIADPSGVAYWPSEDTLLVADLHLEKGSSFARRGQLLPPYDTMETLNRLDAAIDKWKPQRLVSLGDSFHDAHSHKRLSGEATALLAQMMAGRDWLWISGNHDPEAPSGLGGDAESEISIGGLTLRHEPRVDALPGEIAGHLHPKARLIRRGRHIRRSCFVADRNRMILPSFGAYTGGLNVFHRAFAGLFNDRDFHALMRGEEQIYRIPAQELA